MKREFSAGGLVYKRIGDKVVWLIRRPAVNPEFKGNLGWSFPKGWIDDEEGGKEPGKRARGEVRASGAEMEESALGEVREEGGAEAKIVGKLPTIRFFFTNQTGEKVMKFITYYVMGYVGEAAEGVGWETAEVKWVEEEEALKLLAFKSEREMLLGAKALVQ